VRAALAAFLAGPASIERLAHALRLRRDARSGASLHHPKGDPS